MRVAVVGQETGARRFLLRGETPSVQYHQKRQSRMFVLGRYGKVGTPHPAHHDRPLHGRNSSHGSGFGRDRMLGGRCQTRAGARGEDQSQNEQQSCLTGSP